MEKYKRFTDQATGVNPFVPYRKKLSNQTTIVEKFIVTPLRALLVSPPLFFIEIIIYYNFHDSLCIDAICIFGNSY